MKSLCLALLIAALAACSNAQRITCYTTDFRCDDGYCVPNSYRCDGDDDCFDASDEDNCVNVGLAVGLSVFFFILFCVIIPIVVCVLIWCCVAGALGQSFRSRPVTTTVTTHPATASTVVMQSDVKSDYPPPYVGAQPMQQYPPQQVGYPAQPAGYPAQPAGYPAQPVGYPAQQLAYPPQ